MLFMFKYFRSSVSGVHYFYERGSMYLPVRLRAPSCLHGSGWVGWSSLYGYLSTVRFV